MVHELQVHIDIQNPGFHLGRIDIRSANPHEERKSGGETVDVSGRHPSRLDLELRRGSRRDGTAVRESGGGAASGSDEELPEHVESPL